MGAWSGKWNLSAASADYAALNVGRFSLKTVTGQPDKFKVISSPKSKKAKWLGVVFQLKSGQPGPTLPWPVPNSTFLEAAGNHIKGLVKARWGQEGRIYDYLIGDVDVAGTVQTIVLFKADKGLHKDKDILVCLLELDLSGGVSPDGSVTGVRR